MDTNATPTRPAWKEPMVWLVGAIPAASAAGWCVATKEELSATLRPRLEVEVCQ